MNVLSLSCPRFAPIVESNEINSSVAKKIVYESMAPLVDRVDTLVWVAPTTHFYARLFRMLWG